MYCELLIVNCDYFFFFKFGHFFFVFASRNFKKKGPFRCFTTDSMHLSKDLSWDSSVSNCPRLFSNHYTATNKQTKKKIKIKIIKQTNKQINKQTKKKKLKKRNERTKKKKKKERKKKRKKKKEKKKKKKFFLMVCFFDFYFTIFCHSILTYLFLCVCICTSDRNKQKIKGKKFCEPTLNKSLLTSSFSGILANVTAALATASVILDVKAEKNPPFDFSFFLLAILYPHKQQITQSKINQKKKINEWITLK